MLKCLNNLCYVAVKGSLGKSNKRNITTSLLDNIEPNPKLYEITRINYPVDR